MIVLVEGRDGSGKSTLCDELYKSGVTVIKVPRHNNYCFEDLFEYGKKHTLVCDRSFITDIVYRIFDGEPTELSLSDMAKLLEDSKVRIVYCYTPNDYVNSINRGEDNIISEEDSDNILNIYETIIKLIQVTVGIPIMEYNWTKNKVQEVIDFIYD